MFHWLDYLTIGLYFGFLVLLGHYLTKRGGNDHEAYFLGGRRLHWSLLGLSMVATTFAADTPLAVTELVRKYGIAGNWLWWSFLIGGIFTATIFAHLWRRLGVTTDIEFIAIRYDDASVKWLRAGKALLYGVVFNCMIMAWVNTAMATLLKHFFSLSTGGTALMLGLLLLATALYSALSGLLGIVIIDAIQFSIAFLSCVLLAYRVIYHSPIGSLHELLSKVPQDKLSFFPDFETTATDFSLALLLTYLLVQWWASWYPGAEPGGGGYIAQRILAARDEREATKATLLFNFLHYLIRPWPWILVALATLILYPHEPDHKATYVMAMNDYMPEGLKGLMFVAFLSAYMSTISTHLNWGSSYLVNDLLLLFQKPSEKQLMGLARAFTFFLMAVAFVLSFFIQEISEIWRLLIASGAGTGFALIARWVWTRMNGWSELVATLSPPLFLLLLHLRQPPLPETTQYLLTVLFTICSTIIATYLFPPPSPHTIERFYKQKLQIPADKRILSLFLRKLPQFVWYTLLFLIGLYLITLLLNHI